MLYAFLFPRFKILSGAERLILKLAAALAEKGHSIHILSHQFDDSCRPLLVEGIELHTSGISLDYFDNRYANAAFDYFRSSRLIGLLPEKVDAVCCFGPALTALHSLRRKTSSPIFYFCYEPPRFLYTDRALIQKRLGVPGAFASPVFNVYRKRDQKLVKQVDAVLCNSEFGRQQIQEVYGRDATVITHGLEPYHRTTKRDEIRGACGIKRNELAVLSVNYLHPRKRLELFVETIKVARTQNPSIRGVIVGDGPERALLEESAGDTVRFTGFIPESKLSETYQSADVYLHTSRLETFGLSVIEAAGNCLPVVSVDEGGPLETILEGKTGFLREPSAESLASPLLALSPDQELRRQMGQQGFEFVRGKYSWEKGADDFLSVLQKN